MPEPLDLILDRLDTPIGQMLVAADREGNLRAIDWVDYEGRMERLLGRQYGKTGYTLKEEAMPTSLKTALQAYFAGDHSVLDTLPVKFGGTAFQRKVWEALRNIPCGQTVTYSGLATTIGNPTAVRAVGLANGSNPVGVVVPCHRVIGANGSLTGYGGGLHRKSWLLEHEGIAKAAKQGQTKLF